MAWICGERGNPRWKRRLRQCSSMIEVSNYILNPENGAILCAECYKNVGVAYEMAVCETLDGYACEETESGHFLPHKYLEMEN